MAGVNKVILVGNLGADPEARSLNNGGEVVNMRVATSESWKDRDGNRQERTEWHNVVIFNENLGRVAKSYLRKGSQGLSRRPDPDPQMDRPVGQRPLYDRDRAAALPRRAGAARQPRRRRRRRRGAFSEDFGGDDFGGGGGSQRRSRARSRRRSTPTWTTTFRSRSSSLSPASSLASAANGPASASVSTPASLSAASAPALRG